MSEVHLPVSIQHLSGNTSKNRSSSARTASTVVHWKALIGGCGTVRFHHWRSVYYHLLHTSATHAHVLTVTAKNPTPDLLLHPWEWPSPWGESSCPRPPLWSHSKDSRAQGGVPLCARRPFSLSPPPPHSLSPIWFMVERRPAAAWGAAHSQIHPLNPKTRGWIHAHESVEKQKNIITCQRDVNNWSSFSKCFETTKKLQFLLITSSGSWILQADKQAKRLDHLILASEQTRAFRGCLTQIRQDNGWISNAELCRLASESRGAGARLKI